LTAVVDAARLYDGATSKLAWKMLRGEKDVRDAEFVRTFNEELLT
jgi:hypothetical protein